MNTFDALANGKELISIRKERSKKYIFKKVPPQEVNEYLNNGWVFSKKFKSRIEVKKEKPVDEQFCDLVWMLMSKLEFSCQNRDRSFIFRSDEKERNLEQLFDVVAIDEEIALFVICKATEEENAKLNLKSDIDNLNQLKHFLIASLRTHYPDRKVKIIIATKNFIVSKQDQEKLRESDLALFNEDSISYYEELGEHLGASSRFQLLASLFPNQRIMNMVCTIPAIEGRMGGQKYYAFSIEPERLLKIAYVLHRDNANDSLMPTYQRIIKKTRLQAVQAFVDHGGFFPNSIVISIDTKGKGLRFDLSNLQDDTTISKIGILHLPQTYRSAYVIDGQHRLYGYSNSKYEKSNSIPVVAFLDLPQDQQIKLFMEINENQKSVSKNLRLTLQSDILWDSKSLSKRRVAIKAQIAEDLGSKRLSPLYNRVIIGENKKTDTRFLTIDTIQSAIGACEFLSKFNSKNEIRCEGTFDKGESNGTYTALYDFLETSLNYFKVRLADDWDVREEKKSFVMSNNGVWALIKMFNDIANHMIENSLIIKDKGTELIVETCKPYYDALITYIKSLSEDQKQELSKRYGSGGKASCWHDFQKAVHEKFRDFLPISLDEYLKKQEMKFNEDSYRLIRFIELYLKEDFYQKLVEKYGENWLAQGVPKIVYDDMMKLKSDKEYELKQSGDSSPVEPMDCLNLINYRTIALYKSNWPDLFSADYTFPDEGKKSGGKEARTEWMVKLNTIRNQNFHKYSISEEEYKFINDIYNWLRLRVKQ